MSDAAAPATQPRPGGTAKGGNRACFKCGKTGHWSKDCTAPREEWIPQQPRAEAGVPQSPTDVGAAEGEDGAPAKPASVAKKKSNRKPKFTAVEHLLGPNGVSYVYNQIPEKFAAIAKGPGHEFGDFARLVGLYREWTRKMYPHATHEEVMKKVRTHSKTREVRATVREFKEKARLEAGGDPEDAPPPDFEAEDVFFPDEDDDDDDDDVRAAAGKGAGAGDDDDEEEWNDAVHGGEGGGDDEDEELAILMEQERAFAEGSGSGSREELRATRAAEEARAAAFDEARRDGADDANANVDVNFDESSEDDDDFEIAAPRAGRAARAAPGERGKARKKVKERAGRKGGKKAEAAAAREAAEAAEEMLAPEPEAAPEPEGRKKLGGRRNRSKPADEDSDDSDGDAGDAAARRPRRKVATALDDSDDDDDDDGNTAAPLPTTMGGDAFDAEPLPADTRPSFLYDSDSDDVGGKKRKAEAEAEAE